MRIKQVVLFAVLVIVVPALSDAEEQPSLAQALSDRKEKATGSWIRWDGGVFVSETEYIDFSTDVKNQFFIVEEDWRTIMKSTGQVYATGWRRLTIPLAELDPELIEVISQKSFSDSLVKVFFVSLISLNDDQAVITVDSTEKRRDEPETAVSGAWAEEYLVLPEEDCAADSRIGHWKREKQPQFNGRAGGCDERLREFLRFDYLTGNQVARRIASETQRFSKLSAGRASGHHAGRYEYREYKNWRGIPKPRRCPFRKRAKGAVRKAKRMFQGVCPNCGATDPKRGVMMRR